MAGLIIDAHSHWLPDEIIDNAHFFHKAWGDLEAHMKMMQANGIARSVLSYPTSDAHLKLGGPAVLARIFNDNIGQVIKKYGSKFIGAAVMPVGDPRKMVDELRRAHEMLGFKMVSLASSYDGIYLDDPMFLPLYKEAAVKRMPVFVHSQIVNPIGFEKVKDPLLTPVIEYVFDTTICIGKLLMSDILRNYPDLIFIFAYFGGAIPHLAHRFDATYQMLRSMNFVKDLTNKPTELLKNIYVDSSGDTTRTNFEAALNLFGPRHLLWGSDWPAKKDIGAGVKAIDDLNITDKDKADILGGNLAELLAP